MEIEFIEYSKFRHSSEYRRYCASVYVNMHKLGFVQLNSFELEKGDNVKEIIKAHLKLIKIKTGKIIIYRARDGWSCPHIVYFWKDVKKK